MKLSEVLSLENNNNTAIHLLKDGLFWRAYETSAYLFITHIKEYQLTKKYYKNINKEIVYLDFPDSVLEEILSKTSSNIVRTEKQITLKGYQCNISHYEEWKSNIELKIGGAACSSSNNSTDTPVDVESE